MAKQKGYTVRESKAKGRNLVVGVITASQQRTMQRAASRQKQINSGVKVGSGAGYHGGNKTQTNKRERRQGRVQVSQEQD